MTMNYIKLAYNIFVVKNQNGFNNALYDYMDAYGGRYSIQEIRSMVTDFPKRYPAAVIFHKEYETYRIYVEALNKNEMPAMLECFEKVDYKDEIIAKPFDLIDSIDTYADLQINGSKTDKCFSWIENKTQEINEEHKQDEVKQKHSSFEIAKCGECPFYYGDEKNVRNSFCRYGNGWGWGLFPTEECHFKQSLVRLKDLSKITRITW